VVVYRSLVAADRNALRRAGRALLPVAVVVPVTAALHLLGVAGYQAGEILVAVILAIAGGATAWWAYRPFEAHAVWAVTFAVLCSSLTGVLAPPAPWSAGRLAAELDAAELPFTEIVDESRSGRSWCMPRCPAIERVYRGPAITARAAAAEVAFAFVDAGLAPPELLQRLDGGSFALSAEDVRIEVHAEPENDELPSPILITIRLEARR